MPVNIHIAAATWEAPGSDFSPYETEPEPAPADDKIPSLVFGIIVLALRRLDGRDDS